MNGLREALNQNWLSTTVGLIGLIVGSIGIFLAFSFRPRPRLAAQVNSLELVGVDDAVLPNEIEFLYRGKKVPKVTLSRIAIWNIGNTTLRGDQIVESDPLRVVMAEGSNLLEVGILNRTREVNGFSTFPRSDRLNEFVCTYDYLDPGDGALIQVIHTGTADVEFAGTIRGIQKPVLNFTFLNKRRRTHFNERYSRRNLKEKSRPPGVDKAFAVIAWVAGLALMGVSYLLSGSPQNQDVVAMPLLVGVMSFFGGIMLWRGAARRAPTGLSVQITSREPVKSMFAPKE
jgi:hypothetical protein